MADNGGGSSPTNGGNDASWPPATDVAHYAPAKGDAAGGDSRSRARTQIVSIWSDRLQLASVLATFFTSIDSLLFSLSVNQHNNTNAGELMTSAFSGALVFHAAAAILSYIGAFVLIQFKLANAPSIPTETHSAPPTFHSPKVAAKHPAVHIAGHHPPGTHSSHARDTKIHPSAHQQSPSSPLLSPPLDFLTRSTSALNDWLHSVAFPSSPSSHIYIEVVHPFTRKKVNTSPEPGPDDDDPETNIDALSRLLLRCHRACSAFTLIGFTLLLIGVVSFAWTVLDRAVGIFTSCCVAVALVVALYSLH